MKGMLNLKKKSFYCQSLITKELDKNEIYLDGNLFLRENDLERILSKIARDYPNLDNLKNLQGHFAIVLFNKRERNLSLIRDQFGVMPLYYSIAGERIIFATTITPILEETNQNININQNVIHEYFMFRYVSGENTFFNNILEVKPGSIVQIDSNGKITKKDYYQFKYSSSSTESKISASSKFENEFWKSLKKQTFDKDKKKIGVLSSGGIDSSILVSCASKILSPGFHTYYIANEGYEHNRTEDVNYLGRIYNTNHRNVFISSKEFADNLTETIRINEEPLNHPSSVLRNYLLKQINGEVDVLLSGEGADCFYCGYYIFDLINYFYVKNSMRSLTSFIMQFLPVSCFPKCYQDKVTKIKKVFTLPPDKYAIFHDLLAFNTKENIELVLKGEFPPNFGRNYSSLFLNYSRKNILDIILYIYQTLYIIEAFNTVAKLGNANNIEHRHIFINTVLADLFNNFPWTDKIRFFTRKHQVVELGKKHLPREFFKKPKEGFGVPLQKWFYDKKGLGRFVGLLNDEKTRNRGILNKKYLDDIINLFHGKSLDSNDYECILWPIINMELWCRIFIDRDIKGYS